MRTTVLTVALLIMTSKLTAAPLSFVANPEGAWSYSFQTEGIGDNPFYVPHLSDLTNAVFQGYTIDATPLPESFGGVPPYSQAFSFHLFETNVMSRIDQTVAVQLDGDDGHSLYVDGLFVGGGGYGVPVNYDLHFSAGVPINLKIVGYNGPGNWSYFLKETNDNLGLQLSAVPGIRMNAVAIPEGSSLLLSSIPVFALVVWAFSRKRRFIKI